jgi:hypothetical protein
MSMKMVEKKQHTNVAVTERTGNFWADKSPCWEMCQCPKVIKDECPAARYTNIPCWEMEGTYCKLSDNGTSGTDTSICAICKVYKRWGNNRPIELILTGHGINTTIRPV